MAEGAQPATAELAGSAEVEIRPEGWAEEMYLRYVTAIDKIFRPIFKSHAFEFPEARNLQAAEIASGPDGASARITMNVERLVRKTSKASLLALRPFPAR